MGEQAARGVPKEADRERVLALSLALKALAANRVEEATVLAEGLLRRWPDDAAVRQFMAALALRQSKPEDAERWAQLSLEIRPRHFATLMIAANAARMKRDWRTVLDRCALAAEAEPDRPEAAFGAAIAAIALDPAESSFAVERLRRRFPAAANDWADLGAALERAERRDLAAEAFGLAARGDSSAKVYLRWGAALLALGRRGEAASAFQKALQIDPDSAETWFKLGLTLQDSRHPHPAAQAYRRALALKPDLAEAQANLGVALQETGDLDGAKQAYGRALLLMPSAFGRIAQALTGAPKGELWLDLNALHAHLSELGRLSR